MYMYTHMCTICILYSMCTQKIIYHIQTLLLTVHFCWICVYFSACFYHATQTLSPCVCVCLHVYVRVCVCLIIASVVAYTHSTHNTQGGSTQYQHVFATATASRRGCGDPPPPPYPYVLSTLPCHPPALPPLWHCCTPIRAIAQNAKFSPFSLFVSFVFFFIC